MSHRCALKSRTKLCVAVMPKLARTVASVRIATSFEANAGTAGSVPGRNRRNIANSICHLVCSRAQMRRCLACVSEADLSCRPLTVPGRNAAMQLWRQKDEDAIVARSAASRFRRSGSTAATDDGRAQLSRARLSLALGRFRLWCPMHRTPTAPNARSTRKVAVKLLQPQ
jgi:hypothetical protein